MSRFAFAPVPLLLAACVPDTADVDLTPTPEPTPVPTEVHWGYQGENGPDTWAEHFPTCGGEEQSPIDLTGNEPEAAGPVLTFHYTTTTLDAENNGHTVKFNVDGGSTLDIDGVTYTLDQFHFHAQSEHTFGGEHAPMEMHLVHLNGAEIAVVGMFIFEGEEPSPWFEAAQWDDLPTSAESVLADPATMLDLDDLMLTQVQGETRDYVHYDGSLTTPDCSEGVKWFVLGQFLELSPDQIAQFVDIYPNNYRPVQPVGARTPIYDGFAGE